MAITQLWLIKVCTCLATVFSFLKRLICRSGQRRKLSRDQITWPTTVNYSSVPKTNSFIHHKVFIALPGKVAPESQKGCDINPIHMFSVLHITAQVELGQQDLRSFFL
eukprot:bmy_14141T0